MVAAAASANSTSGAIANNLYRGDGTAPPVSTHSTTGSMSDPRINNAGNTATLTQSVGSKYIIYDGRVAVNASGFLGSTLFTDPDYGATGAFSPTRIDVGDDDRIVFAANWAGLTNAFYLWDNGTISKVAGTDGLTGIPAINDLGVVAGLVSGNGPERLALFEGGVEGTILSVGWAFDGSTITDLHWAPEGFNNLNQTAFPVSLADGRLVNVIAQLPEPGAAGMLLFAGAVTLLRPKRVR